MCDISTPDKSSEWEWPGPQAVASSGLLIWITNKITDGENYLDEFMQDTQFRVQCFTNVLQSVFTVFYKVFMTNHIRAGLSSRCAFTLSMRMKLLTEGGWLQTIA